MKKLLIFFIFCNPFMVRAQTLDSIELFKQFDSLRQIWTSHFLNGDNNKLIETALIAKELILSKIGKQNVQYAECCHVLGIGKQGIGLYEIAESFLLEGKLIRESILGKTHPVYAKSTNSLGIICMQTGRYESAELYFLETKNIWEMTLGNEHPNYASVVSNLAALYFLTGRFELAESFMIETKLLDEKHGKETAGYAQILSNLANVYKEMGRTKEAEALLIESKEIRAKIFGNSNPDYAESLNNLAALYIQTERYTEAEVYLIQAKNIVGEALGKEHPNYAAYLDNIGSLYNRNGSYEKAEYFLLEAKRIREKILGKNHPEYAWSLNNLAVFYVNTNRLNEAEELYLEAKTIREKILGKNHPQYFLLLTNMTRLYYKMGNYHEVASLLKEATSIRQKLFTNATQHLSEKEMNQYFKSFQLELNSNLSFLYTCNHIHPEISKICYDNTLFNKGYLLNAINHLRKLVSQDSTSIQISNVLASYQRRLAQEYVKPIKDRDSVSISKLEEKSNQAEKLLIKQVKGYKQVIQQINWQQIQHQLKPNEAAIEFVHFDFNFPNVTDSVIYGALLLRPNDQQPIFISLFEEKQLIKLITRNKEVNSISQIYASRGFKPNQQESLEGLYQLIWKPMDTLLEHTKQIYFSPSGLLHRINFDAIPIDSKYILSDKFQLSRLGSTRSIIVTDTNNITSNNKAVIFGGIQYDFDNEINELITNVHNDSNANLNETSYLNKNNPIYNEKNNWIYLPGTKNELEEITPIIKESKFNITTFMGKLATEESFKSLGIKEKSPTILHIATHGFFFPDPARPFSANSAKLNDSTKMDITIKAETTPLKVELKSHEPVFKTSTNPMIRSGLILAGGNYAWSNGKLYKEGTDDGVLTAYEISQMDLSNTDLVVLSACETGLGDIQGSEGVYGLQRAFKIAGVKYLIMSLWSVPDEETKEFMILFYKNWLNNKMTIPLAFSQTQREMRNTGMDIYQWAGFILVE